MSGALLAVQENLSTIVLWHSTRLVCAAASTIALGKVFMNITFVQGAILGSCGSIAWSISVFILKHFGCSQPIVRSVPYLGPIFMGIPLTGLAYGCLGGNPLLLSLSITFLTLGGSILGNLIFAAVSVAAIAIATLVNNGAS